MQITPICCTNLEDPGKLSQVVSSYNVVVAALSCHVMHINMRTVSRSCQYRLVSIDPQAFQGSYLQDEAIFSVQHAVVSSRPGYCGWCLLLVQPDTRITWPAGTNLV